MNLYKIKTTLKQYSVFYLLGLLLIFGMKYFYSNADSDDLFWILAPTTKWVSILSGIPFEYESGIGYVNHSLRYIIAPSCSGVQFMIIVMAMLIFSFTHRLGASCHATQCTFSDKEKRCITSNWRRCLGWIATSILSSYLFTIFVNGLRIIVAIYLPLYLSETGIYGSFLTPGSLHTMIGTAVYFIALLTLYRLLDSVTGSISDAGSFKRKFLPPVFWYFFIVLGIPLLNRANRANREQFTEYAMLITCVCAAILLIYILTLLFHSQKHKKQQS